MSRSTSSLKKTALAFLLLFIAFTSAAGGFFLKYYSDQFMKDISERNLFLARHVSEHVAIILDHHLSVLRELKHFIEKHGELEALSEGGELDWVRRFHPLIEQILVLDDDGVVHHLSPYLEDYIGMDMSRTEGFQGARKLAPQEAAYLSDSFFSPRTNHPAVTISLPLGNGVLMADLNLTELSNLVTLSHGTAGIVISVTDGRGNIIAHPSQNMVRQRTNRLNLVSIRSAMEGNPGTFSESRDGEKGLSSTVLLKNSRWVVSVFQPESLALKILIRSRNIALGGLALLVILGIAVFLVLHGKWFRPIQTLAVKADMIAAGQYGDDLASPYSELSGLVHSFNKMKKAVMSREEQLMASEERFRAAFMTSPDAMTISHFEKGVYEDVNEAFTSITGWQRDEVMGKTVGEVGFWIISFSRDDLMRQLIQKRTCENLEIEFQRKDGTVRAGLASASLIHIDGQVHVLTLTKDITELKQAYSLLSDIIDSSPLAMVQLDSEGTVRLWNPAAEKLFGWRSEEVLGTSAPQVAPDMKEEHYLVINKTIAEGHVQGFETRRLRKNGSAVDVRFSTTLMETPEGENDILVIYEDITERKKAEAVLREREKQYRLLYENNPLAYQCLNHEGVILEVNQAHLKLLGYDREEVVGHPFTRLVAPDSMEIIETCIATFMERTEGHLPEVHLLRKGGEIISVGIFRKSSLDEETGEMKAHCLFQDITEQKQMEQAMMRNAQLAAVGQVASGIAHEINNPLATISATTEALLARIPALRKDLAEGSEAHGIVALFEDYLLISQEEVNRSGKIMRDLLDFARMRDHVLKPVDIVDLTLTTVRFLNIQSRLENFSFVTELDKDFLEIPGDRDRIRQVLVILLSNAVEAMPSGGRVTVTGRVDQEKDHYALSVSDMGEGIDEEDIPRIFEPFFTTKGPGGGTGLGLSIADSIVRKHHGRITAHRNDSGGMTFTIFLPAGIQDRTGSTGVSDVRTA